MSVVLPTAEAVVWEAAVTAQHRGATGGATGGGFNVISLHSTGPPKLTAHIQITQLAALHFKIVIM